MPLCPALDTFRFYGTARSRAWRWTWSPPGISDAAFAGVTPEQLPALLPAESRHAHGYLADRTTFGVTGNPLTVVDLRDQPGRHFWLVFSAFADVENSLASGKSSFDELSKA